jgi:sulfide:quinone oxidoreductase
MPIKCAGAPQKALYLSGDHWYRAGNLKDIDIQFCNAGGVLFGVKDYVPALDGYMRSTTPAELLPQSGQAIDGPAKKAWFRGDRPDGNKRDRRGPST